MVHNQILRHGDIIKFKFLIINTWSNQICLNFMSCLKWNVQGITFNTSHDSWQRQRQQCSCQCAKDSRFCQQTLSWHKMIRKLQSMSIVMNNTDCKSGRHILWHCTSSLSWWWHGINLDWDYTWAFKSPSCVILTIAQSPSSCTTWCSLMCFLAINCG